MADASEPSSAAPDDSGPVTPGTGDRVAEHAVVPVVGKTPEAAIVVPFVGLLTAVLFGGVVPDHRAAVGHELVDRTLTAATEQAETTAVVPKSVIRGSRRVDAALPRAIRGNSYRIACVPNATLVTDPNVTAPALVLDHPNNAFDRRLPMTLPDSMSVSGAWDSGNDCVVRVVVDDDDGTTLELANGRTDAQSRYGARTDGVRRTRGGARARDRGRGRGRRRRRPSPYGRD